MTVIEIADAIKTALDGESDLSSATITTALTPEARTKETTTPQIIIALESVKCERVTKQTIKKEVRLQIGLLKLLESNDTNEDFEECAEMLESIATKLALHNFENIQIPEATIGLFYEPARLREARQYFGTVNVRCITYES